MNKQRICVVVGKKTLHESLAAALAVAGQADVIEIRLDLMQGAAVTPFIENITTPLLFTNRAKWEGGGFTGEESARLTLLNEAVTAGATYVDLEILAPQDSWTPLRRAANKSGTQLIASWHNFEKTPPQHELLEKMQMMKQRGADIGKIVTMANDPSDALCVLNLQKHAREMNFPFIAFCMGEAGVMSRVATVALDGYMTYCALDEGEAVAPGQVSLAVMLDIYSSLGIVRK